MGNIGGPAVDAVHHGADTVQGVGNTGQAIWETVAGAAPVAGVLPVGALGTVGQVVPIFGNRGNGAGAGVVDAGADTLAALTGNSGTVGAAPAHPNGWVANAV